MVVKLFCVFYRAFRIFDAAISRVSGSGGGRTQVDATRNSHLSSTLEVKDRRERSIGVSGVTPMDDTKNHHCA